MIPLAAFGLIVVSACLHASWNVVIRSLKGNTPVLVLAHCVGSLLLIPFAILTPDLGEMFLHPKFWPLMSVSAGCQALYNLMIAAAYVVGDVGLVYPLARGTSIILATVVSQTVSIDEELQLTEYCAITAIICGIAGLCYDTIMRKPQTAGYSPVSDVDIEVNSVGLASGSPSKPQLVRRNSVSAEESGDSLQTADQQRRRVLPNNANDAENPTPEQLKLSNVGDDRSMPLMSRLTQDKVTLSIVMAICVGTCTGSYSIADSMSVKIFPMVPWYCVSSVLSSLILLPCILVFYYEKTVDALLNQKLNILLMSPPVIGAYMIILHVFTFPGINVAVVVSVREFSVVIGSVLGVLFLNEPFTLGKFASIGLMLVGMIMVKVL